MTKLAFSNTTGKHIIAECRRLCRVPDHRHSAKRSFAECQRHSTRQTYGTRHGLPLPSADRRQKATLGIYYLCRVLLFPHSAKAAHVPSTRSGRAPAVGGGGRPLVFAECRQLALGKDHTSPSAISWHSANTISPSA